MNVITIAGNVTADAETRYLSDGKPVVSFSVADNKGKDKPAIFWRCSWFGERAEKVAQYLTKGGSVTATGTINERMWTDKDGHERKTMEVMVNDVTLQGGRQTDAPRQPQRQPQRQAPAHADSGFDSMDSDVPF